MANPFYSSGEQRAAKVDELFAAIARRYDRMNDLQSFGLHRLWKRRLAQLAGVSPGARALDVCCGTGDIAFALARRGAQVTGLDFNAPMLAEAQARRGGDSRSGTSNPAFIRGDAQRIPFPDGTCDIVTVGYGLRNLADWGAGLREMQRVARPGGRLLVLDFGKPDNPLWRRMYFNYLRLVVPVLGRIVCGNAAAYAYILESLNHFPAQHGVESCMRQQGLDNVRILSLLGGMMTINYGVKTESNRASG